MSHTTGGPPIEKRSLPGEGRTEVRMEERDGKQVLVGYAAVFNSLSEDLGGFRELIRPGAFQRSLDGGADVRALKNHDPHAVLGRRGAGTLRLAEDDYGLRYEIDVPDTTTGRDTAEEVRRKDLPGSSFSFATVSDSWNYDEAGGERQITRELREAHLFDVGPVCYPAYRDTTVALRSLDQFRSHSGAEFTPTPDQVLTLQRLRLAELS